LRSYSRTNLHPADINVSISQVIDGIYRIAGFVEGYGITFNQFLIEDENPTLIHTGPVGMYAKIEEKLREVINLEK
jgi:flavorubredoxin